MEALRNHNWSSFARGYNGPDYKVNQYDTKMKENYELYKNDEFKGYNMLDEVVVIGKKK